MKTLILSILCLLAVSGKSQWDSVAVKQRLSMASFKMQEYSNQSIAGYGMIAGGLGIVGTFGVLSKEKPEFTGIAAGGAFIALFGFMLCGTANLHLKESAFWLSPTGATFTF